MDDGEVKIEDAELKRALRRQAIKVYAESILIGIGLTAACWMIP